MPEGVLPVVRHHRRRATEEAEGHGRQRGLRAPLRGAADAGPVDTTKPFNILVTGVGGTGVVTIGALIGMAAHIDGKGVSVLDMTGLAQKFGAVYSHLRIADRPADITPRASRLEKPMR